MAKIYFRHEKLRKYQDVLVNDTYEAIEKGMHLLAHAPVGLGKTDAVLSPAITHALEKNLDVFFLTPKISQHRIALDVVKGIEEKYGLRIPTADVVGRRYMCIHPSLEELDQDSFYQACEKMRKKEMCEYYKKARGYNKTEQQKAKELFKKLFHKSYNHLEVVEIGKKCEACPYEWTVELAKKARVIVADYFHLTIPGVRQLFLLKTKKSLENSIIIVDEAHNLPKRVREQLSTTINSFMMRRVDKEMKQLGLENAKMEKTFNEWAREVLGDNKEILLGKEMFSSFVEHYNMPIGEMAEYFEAVGLEWVERTTRKSYCLKLAKFLKNWEGEEASAVRILRKKDGYFSLSKKFLDPSISTSELGKAHSLILMSGTLLPLEMYRDVLGLKKERTVMKQYGSPFSKENRINIIVEGLTTKYSRRNFEEYEKFAEKIDGIASMTPGGTAVFFASYKVMNNVLPMLKTRPVFAQREGMRPKEVYELFKRFSEEGGLLCAVQGGSLSEGIDYNKGQIKTVIIAGIALEEMGLEVEALIDYYQEKFGKGWEYGYIYPAIMKAMQAAGRAIRKHTDRAAIVYMDERFKWKNYKKLFSSDESFVITNEPEKYVERFWRTNGVK
ncbi:MAG: ATP-dependent DNA helicase [Candidatus Anstonellales archaeon]